MPEALKTRRTVLRPFSEDDADQLPAIFRDPAVRRFLLDDTIVSPEWVRSEIADSQRRFGASSAGLWAIRQAGKPAILGFVGFRHFFDPPQLQLLYGLLPDYWGNGLATEAAARVCDYAFRELDFPEVVAAVDVPNHASTKVLVRLGMNWVRTTSDGAADTAFYRVDREAWMSRDFVHQNQSSAD